MTDLTSHLAAILARDLAALRREIEAYPDDALPWREVPGLTNPGGTLALHVAGNLQHYVGHVLGGSGYVRDRPAEFAELVHSIAINPMLNGETIRLDGALRMTPK